jgi:hypothetical protein
LAVRVTLFMGEAAQAWLDGVIHMSRMEKSQAETIEFTICQL